MGFSFRKSIGLGPFRVNLSKSGVGLSTGVKGARISTGPSGTKVYGGWGPFRYQKEIAPGVGAVGKRGSWGVGSIVMMIVVVGAWAFTKYYKPATSQTKTHHTASSASGETSTRSHHKKKTTETP